MTMTPGNGAPQEQTPLDLDAGLNSSPVASPPRSAATATAELPPGYTKTTTRTTIKPDPAPHAESQGEQGGGGEEETPLDLDAAVSARSVEVSRVGPGTGTGWQGRNYNGHEPTYARVGFFPNTKEVYDRVQAVAGGGAYSFKGRDRNGKAFTVEKSFGGAPLPLPGDDPDAYNIPEGFVLGQDGLLYPKPGHHGHGLGAQGYGAGYGNLFGEQQGLVDAEGYATPAAQHEGLGWVWVMARQQYKWTGPGAAPGPPPPAPGRGDVYDSPYDHRSRDGGPLAEVLKKMEKLLERPQRDPMDMLVQMENQRRQADQDRYQREKDERDRRERQEDKDRAEAAMATAEAMKAKADSDKEIARLNADAMKHNATQNAEAAKEMAKVQQTASDSIIKILMQKTDTEGSFDKMLDRTLNLAQVLTGQKSELAETAAVVKDVVKEGLPAVTQAISDIVITARGGTAAAPANAPLTEEQKMIGMFSMLLDCCQNGVLPERMPLVLVASCRASYNDYEKVKSTILLGGPAAFGKWIDDHAAMAGDEDQKQTLRQAKELVTSEKGKAWIAGLQKALRGPEKPALTAAPPAAPTK